VGPVIGDLLPLALGIAISPVPIIAIILLLLSPRPGLTSVGFLVGWVVAIAVVVTAVALLYDPVDDSDSSGPSTTTSVVKLVLGLLSIALAVKQWGGRPKPGEKAVLPKWMAAIDKVTPVRSLDMGALLSGLNPKNLTLGLAAGVTIGGCPAPTRRWPWWSSSCSPPRRSPYPCWRSWWPGSRCRSPSTSSARGSPTTTRP
jgi:hypothetical protein